MGIISSRGRLAKDKLIFVILEEILSIILFSCILTLFGAWIVTITAAIAVIALIVICISDFFLISSSLKSYFLEAAVFLTLIFLGRIQKFGLFCFYVILEGICKVFIKSSVGHNKDHKFFLDIISLAIGKLG